MKRFIAGTAVIALLVAAAATPVDLSGVVVGPFLMLALGAGASWWATNRFGGHTSDRETYAGMMAAVAAGGGALAGVLLLLGMAAWISFTIPLLQTGMTLARFISHGGVLIGMLLALTDLIFAVAGGLLGELMYERTHTVRHIPH